MFKWYKNLEYIPWQISVRPNSPHVSSMNGSKRHSSKSNNDSDGNQTSFKNNNSKRNVRIRVISSNTSESRPSWYKSMKMRRLSTATGSTRIETKSNLGNRLLRYFLVFFSKFFGKSNSNYETFTFILDISETYKMHWPSDTDRLDRQFFLQFQTNK